MTMAFTEEQQAFIRELVRPILDQQAEHICRKIDDRIAQHKNTCQTTEDFQAAKNRARGAWALLVVLAGLVAFAVSTIVAIAQK